MAIKPGRRWFAYSLRTLFAVMTLACLWLGWQVKTVHDRQAALTWIKQSHVGYLSCSEGWKSPEATRFIEDLKVKGPARVWIASSELAPTAPSLQISSFRKRLGDESISAIGLKNKSDLDRVRRLFPEAAIMVPAD